jgi:hypothetical protein
MVWEAATPPPRIKRWHQVLFFSDFAASWMSSQPAVVARESGVQQQKGTMLLLPWPAMEARRW